MRLRHPPVLRIKGRYFNAKRMWRELSHVLGASISNADSLYDVLTDPFETVDDLTVEWHMPHTPLNVHERKLFDVLMDATVVRDDLTLEFPNPPRWLFQHAKLGL